MTSTQPIRPLAVLAAAAAASTNVNDNADELALYCTWSPDYACAPGAFTFTASASCDGEVPNPTQMISISAIGAITGQANGFNEVTLTLTNVPPGAVTVTFSGAGESHTVTVWSLKVDIVQERVEYCVHHGADTLDLTEESCLGSDTACWYLDGLYVGAGHSHTLTPSTMELGTYTVTA